MSVLTLFPTRAGWLRPAGRRVASGEVTARGGDRAAATCAGGRRRGADGSRLARRTDVTAARIQALFYCLSLLTCELWSGIKCTIYYNWRRGKSGLRTRCSSRFHHRSSCHGRDSVLGAGVTGTRTSWSSRRPTGGPTGPTVGGQRS